MLNVITTSLPFILPIVVFLKALFSVIYSSSCTLPLSVLLSLPFSSTTTFMQIILSCSFLSTHSTLTQASLTFKTLFNISLPGRPLIFLLVTPLRLNSCSSDSKTYSSKYTTLHLISPTLLETLALSLTKILPSLTKLQLSPKPAIITFVSFAVSGLTSIPQLPVPLLPLSFTPNVTTVILCSINSLSLYYLVFSRSRTLARAVVKAFKCCHITPILRCFHWLRITEHIEYKLHSLTYKVLSQLPNLHTFITSSPFNVLAILALHP